MTSLNEVISSFSHKEEKKVNLIILGMPGAGKGTQAKKIAMEYQVTPISTGEMFRSASEIGGDFGERVQEYMDKGALVPDDVTNRLVEMRLQEDDVRKGFILDGYPRTLAQAKALEGFLQSSKRSLDAVLFLEVSTETLRKRLRARPATPLEKGKAPHSRKDDQPEVIEERFRVNERLIHALLTFYQERNLVHIIDGEAEPDVVFERLKHVLSIEENRDVF